MQVESRLENDHVIFEHVELKVKDYSTVNFE